MEPRIIGIGLLLVAMGSSLSLVGHHDGVLGAADPDAMLAQDQTREARTRVLVTGTSTQAEDQFLHYQRQLLLPADMRGPMDRGRWVPVSIRGTDAEAYLHVGDQEPSPGTLLVFEGDIQAYWPLLDRDTGLVATQPVLLLEPKDYYPPLLFKS